LPGSGIGALAEVLRRETQIVELLRTVLERLPAGRGVSDFDAEYRRLIRARLNFIELFGVNLSAATRQYPLSIAYLSLTVKGALGMRDQNQLAVNGSARTSSASSPTRIDDILAGTRRLFVRGEAGSGKTTLLQWIAVRSAEQGFTGLLDDWNTTVPFFLPLRRFTDRTLPAPETFIHEVGRHIADEMPSGWAHDRLRSGSAIVLVDGVDELDAKRRLEVRAWIGELIDTFPRSRFIVTSRPAAVPSDWLGDQRFDVAELEPMTGPDIEAFVRRWHEAVAHQCRSAAEMEELNSYEADLIAAIAANKHMHDLAGYPLLCALLCALNRERKASLPKNRMELYEVALHMILERREEERGIASAVELTRTDKTLLLQDLAYWMIRNGQSHEAADRIIRRIGVKLGSMPQVSSTATAVYRVLVERSGILREPMEGRCDFAHRSFEEYLAGKEAIDGDHIGELVLHAHLDQWHEVIVLAAGHAPMSRRVELLQELLSRAHRESSRGRRDVLRLLALGCLETSAELPPQLREEIVATANGLLPPKSLNFARTLGRAGAFCIDLLAKTDPSSPAEAAATIRAFVESGDPRVLPLLARFGRDSRKPVIAELIRGWPRFDPIQYAKTVLRHYPLVNGEWLNVTDRRLIEGLPYLVNLQGLLLRPPDLEPVPLDFVPECRQLKELHVRNADDLRPLASTQLQMLVIWGVSVEEPLSFAPLAHCPMLKWICIDRPPQDVGSLYELPGLESLLLDRLKTEEVIETLRPLCQLKLLYIGRIDNMINLQALDFLTAPETIGVRWCPNLSDISWLRRRSDSIRSVSLVDCPLVDIAPLADLNHVSELSLYDTNWDLAVLIRMASLKTLRLGGTASQDFSLLRSLEHLEELELTFDEVDLSGLAGKNNLTVRVPKQATIHCADALGAGSRLRRRE
jgi:hypothetical protein